MSSFALTNKALDDLREIGRYTQRTWGRKQRNRYLTTINQYFHHLTANPLEGRECHTIRSDYRKYQVMKHFIFYRIITPDQIEIVRILHERMNIEQHI